MSMLFMPMDSLNSIVGRKRMIEWKINYFEFDLVLREWGQFFIH